MRNFAAPAALLAALSMPAAPSASAAPGFEVQVAGYVDDADGTSFDVAAQLRPADWLSLSIGGGQSSVALVASDFEGRSVHGGIDLRRGRFGAALHASSWDDSDQFSSEIIDAELSWVFADSLELALQFEDRALEIDYVTVGLSAASCRRRPGSTAPASARASPGTGASGAPGSTA